MEKMVNETFYDLFKEYDWDDVKNSIYAKNEMHVRHALNKTGKRGLEDFKALISPAATPFLEEMAHKSMAITQKRFGKTIQMYVPLYLSNECHNVCTYCGFSMENEIPRKTLTDAEILAEVKVLKGMGFEHVLLVTGESNHKVGVDFLEHAIKLVKPYFANISIEVQPLEQNEYERLIAQGINSVMVYQETYHEKEYKTHHPKGKKSVFKYRANTPDRLGKAGIHKIGLGALLGLEEDWRADCFFVALHMDYLEKTYWQTKYSISFPRLRPAEGNANENCRQIINDRQLVQLICAYRLLNEELELSLSTRESSQFRDNVFKLGVTSMSAGSKTDPGGYVNNEENLEQFEISDERTPQEVSQVIAASGYDVVWKDWDMCLQ